MCLRPLYLRVDSTTFSEPIPILAKCGKCIECVIERQNSYKLRLCYEAQRWKHCFFFTLTYRNSTLPKAVNFDTGEAISTCRKVDVRYWLKRLRERYQRSHDGNRFDFKYFICSEYGSTDDYVDDRGRVRKATGRPHYHGLLFCNDSPEFVKEMFADWRKTFGNVKANELKSTKKVPDIREHRSKVANYVAKYCCKGEFASRVDDIESGYIEPSWIISSINIGTNYIDDMKSYHLVQDGLFADSTLRYLPQGPFTIDRVDVWFRSCRGTSRQKWAENVWNYVNEVVDRMFVKDGEARYIMPRYYRLKIYGTTKSVKRLKVTGLDLKFSFDLLESFSQSPVHAGFVRPPSCFTYKTKETHVNVPSSENFLSAAIAYVLRYRATLRSAEEFACFEMQRIGQSFAKIARDWAILDEFKRHKRASLKASKLRSFYQKKHLDNPFLSA